MAFVRRNFKEDNARQDGVYFAQRRWAKKTLLIEQRQKRRLFCVVFGHCCYTLHICFAIDTILSLLSLLVALRLFLSAR